MGRSSSPPSIARTVDLGPAPGDGHQRYDTHRGAEEDRPIAQEKQRDGEERLKQILSFSYKMCVCICACMYVCVCSINE